MSLVTNYKYNIQMPCVPTFFVIFGTKKIKMKHYLLALALLGTSVGHAQNLSGSWTGTLDAGMAKLNLVFNLQTDDDGKTICLMDSPDQGAKGIPTDLLYLSDDSLSVSVPVIGAKYNGRLKEDTLHGTFEQLGRKFELNLSQKILKYNRPQHPSRPYPYTTEDVKFRNADADVVLAGTLTYPIGYKNGDDVPVVLMVTGSGPENRDEEIFEHKPFLVIADFFAKHGIATLRYDDRAVGESSGEYQTANTAEVTDDAKAGIEFLRRLKRFSKVGVLGHSEGATSAFIMGRAQCVDFIVSMAGCGVKGDECLYAQIRKAAELAGQPFTMTKEAYVQMVSAQKNPWLEYFLKYDTTEDIKNTFCPVFALNGDKDCQVVAPLNLSAIEKSLPQNEKSKIKLYPGLNHLFQECATGAVLEYIKIEQTISPVVLEDMAEWINSL